MPKILIISGEFMWINFRDGLCETGYLLPFLANPGHLHPKLHLLGQLQGLLAGTCTGTCDSKAAIATSHIGFDLHVKISFHVCILVLCVSWSYVYLGLMYHGLSVQWKNFPACSPLPLCFGLAFIVFLVQIYSLSAKGLILLFFEKKNSAIPLLTNSGSRLCCLAETHSLTKLNVFSTSTVVVTCVDLHLSAGWSWKKSGNLPGPRVIWVVAFL